MDLFRETFYAGGRYVVDNDGDHRMQGQMYVEHLTPSSTIGTRPHPLIFVHGGTRTGAVSGPKITKLNLWS